MYVSVSDRGEFALAEDSFDSCTVGEEGMGGCIGVRLEGSECFVSLTSITYSHVSEKEGGFLMVECEDGSELLSKPEWESFISEYAKEQREEENGIRLEKE